MNSKYISILILCIFSLIPISLLFLSGLLYNGNLSNMIYRDCDVECKIINKICNDSSCYNEVNCTPVTFDCSIQKVILTTTWKDKTYTNNCYNYSHWNTCPDKIKCQFPKNNPSKLERCLMVNCVDDNKYNAILPLFFGSILLIICGFLWYLVIVSNCRANNKCLYLPICYVKSQYKIIITETEVRSKEGHDCYCN